MSCSGTGITQISGLLYNGTANAHFYLPTVDPCTTIVTNWRPVTGTGTEVGQGLVISNSGSGNLICRPLTRMSKGLMFGANSARVVIHAWPSAGVVAQAWRNIFSL
jgi:hypothetical protein